MIQNAQFRIISVVAKLKKNCWKETYSYYVNIFLTHFEIMFGVWGVCQVSNILEETREQNNSDG